MSKLQFHTLDAFRFFAFLKVYLFHATAVVIAAEGSVLKWVQEHVTYGGGIGVSFFFVLSGFLITYILTSEKISSGKINLKNFFLRRAFRIWPLFFLAVGFAFVIPSDFAAEHGFYMNWGGYEPDWRYSFTFLENYKMIEMDAFPRTTPLSVFWSLCIEEHFYIVWMLVFFFLKRKWIPVYLIISILIAIVFRIFEHQIYGTENISTNDLFTNLDYFAISGLLGYYTATNFEKLTAFVDRIPLFAKLTYIVAIIVLLLYQKAIFSNPSEALKILKFTILAILFSGLILIFLSPNGKLKISDTNIFSRLGRISYGLYVFHIVWIHMTFQYFIDHKIEITGWKLYSLFIAITFCGTVITSIISWYLLEKPFLNLREKYFSGRR